MLDVKVKTRISRQYRMSQTTVKDVLEHMPKQKCSCAEHILKEQALHKTFRVVIQRESERERERERCRGVGRTPLRSIAYIKKTAGKQWQKLAKTKLEWKRKEKPGSNNGYKQLKEEDVGDKLQISYYTLVKDHANYTA